MIAKSNLPAEQDISTFSFHNNSIRCIDVDDLEYIISEIKNEDR